ncbi:ATP-binding protein [Bradyrhizobium oligotrophicum]|uniref:AlbA family DNA-binding domain-containing protein n=1 Tax=Bradyrhizobium TaxID=374 RepID=UPI0028E300C1|nr:ATP-binding protein [Bradyrhizobium sp. SZCCHNS3002]
MVNQFRTFKARADLERLLTDGAVEGTTLEFKDSRSLRRDEEKITELCINVSALANSAGGQIIYGINENKKTNGPIEVDNGVADPSITRDWISQILNARIKPRLPEYSIDPVPLSEAQFGFVISVPQSLIGPHQAPDHRYYQRFGLEVRAMEDYQIKDVMRRTATPDLFVNLSFLEGNRETLRFLEEESRPFNLIARIENRSPQPAFHVVVEIGIDTDFNIVGLGGFTRFDSKEQVDKTPLNWLRWELAAPPGQPVFKEHPRSLNNQAIMLTMNADHISNQEIHDLTVRVLAPGCSRQENWSIVANGPILVLHRPNSPHTFKRRPS